MGEASIGGGVPGNTYLVHPLILLSNAQPPFKRPIVSFPPYPSPVSKFHYNLYQVDLRTCLEQGQRENRTTERMGSIVLTHLPASHIMIFDIVTLLQE